MQKFCSSKYEDEGCCLICDIPEDRNGWNGLNGHGCLCFDCQCTKCGDYTSGSKPDGDGTCDIAADMRIESAWRKECVYEPFEIFNETNKALLASVKIHSVISSPFWIPKKIMENGKIPNWFLEKNNLLSPEAVSE